MGLLATVNLINEQQLNRYVARTQEVQDELSRVARQKEGEARSKLASHRKTGAHEIGSQRDKVDRIVFMTGPDSMAVEEGHHLNRNGEWVEGIHVLRTR